MKSLLFLLISYAIITGCRKNGSAETVPPPPPIDSLSSKLLYEGNFENGPYGTVIGHVRIYQTNGKWNLRLEDFNTNNGPDLKVYLSKEQQPLSFISLGSLKAVTGLQEYSIVGMPDLMEFKYALIHCEKYNHLFGYATLMMK
jgi:hypothetical protein